MSYEPYSQLTDIQIILFLWLFKNAFGNNFSIPSITRCCAVLFGRLCSQYRDSLWQCSRPTTALMQRCAAAMTCCTCRICGLSPTASHASFQLRSKVQLHSSHQKSASLRCSLAVDLCHARPSEHNLVSLLTYHQSPGNITSW